MGHQSIDRFGYAGPQGPGTFGLEEGAIGYMAYLSKLKEQPPAPGASPPTYNYMPQVYLVADFNAGCDSYRCSAGTCTEIYGQSASLSKVQVTGNE